MNAPVTTRQNDQSIIDTETIAVLNTIMSSPYDVLRCGAVQALSKLPGIESVDLLLNALRDEDEDVRSDAVHALRNVTDDRVIPALLENLKLDPCGDVKVLAAEILGNLKAFQAAPILRELVISRECNGQIAWDGNAFFEDGWDDWVDLQIKAIVALGAMSDEAAAPYILTALHDEEGQDLNSIATQALARMGPTGLTALKTLLKDAPDRLQTNIIRAVSTMGHSTAQGFLIELLENENPKLRMAVLQSLAALDHKRPELKKLFDDPDKAIQAEAFILLEPSEQVCTDILLLGGPVPVRIAALKNLESGAVLVADHPLYRLLKFLTDDPSSDVVAAAITTLGHRFGNQSVPLFEDLLQKADIAETVQWSIMHILGSISSKKGITLLQKAALSHQRGVRLEALSSLKKRATDGSERARAILCSLASPLDEEDKEDTTDTAVDSVNEAVLSQLEEAGLKTNNLNENNSTLGAILGDERVAEQWMDAQKNSSDSPDLSEKDLAMLALAARIPKRKKISLDDQDVAADHEARKVSLQLISDFDGKDISELLTSALDQRDEDLCRAASDGLFQWTLRGQTLSAEQIGQVTRLLKYPNPEIRRFALQILSAQPDIEIMPVLSQCVKDTDPLVRAETLRLAAPALSLNQVQDYLLDISPIVRATAIHILAKREDVPAFGLLFDFAFSEAGFHCIEIAQLLGRKDPIRCQRQILTLLRDKGKKQEWATAMDFLKTVLEQKPL